MKKQQRPSSSRYMHHKESEAHIGKESFGVSFDFNPSPHPLLPLFHHHQPKPSSFVQIHVPDDSHPHHAPHFLLSSPHKRSLMNASLATCHHRHPSPTPAHHHRLRHHPRLLPHFSAAATRSALRHLLRLLLLLSLPFLYLLLSPFPSSSPSAAASRSLIVDFLFALTFSSILLLLLALLLNAFPVPSLRLLLSRSSSLLLPRHQPPSPSSGPSAPPSTSPKPTAARPRIMHVFGSCNMDSLLRIMHVLIND